MGMVAFVAPIPPGKTGQWTRFIQEMNGPRRKEYEESRRRYGLWERAFLQTTPHGDMAIIVLEGDHPVESFLQFANSSDPFALWFRQQVQDIHGLDLVQTMSQPMPQMVLNSETGATQQRKAA